MVTNLAVVPEEVGANEDGVGSTIDICSIDVEAIDLGSVEEISTSVLVPPRVAVGGGAVLVRHSTSGGDSRRGRHGGELLAESCWLRDPS